MDIQYITIPIKTTMCSSQLLDVAYELLPQLVDTIESYGEEVEADSEDSDGTLACSVFYDDELTASAIQAASEVASIKEENAAFADDQGE